MDPKRTVSRPLFGGLVVACTALAVALLFVAPSASAGAPYNCPATLVVDSPTTLVFPSPEWSSPRTTLPVVNAWVATAGGLSCSYGPPGSPGVVTIYKNTTATCTPNTARTGFDCDRAP